MKTIAIIPARSGSKGLKDKNIKKLCNKPLLAYSIEAAIESEIFDTVMVSTDSKKYAEIAIQYSAEVPFLRSEATSTDQASTRDCIVEVLEKYRQMGKLFDRLMILQPTSPLRTASHIVEADELYREKDAKAVIGVCEMEHSPLWSNTIDSTLCIKDFIDKEANKRRQEIDAFYRINGAIYLHDVNHYLEREYYFDENAYAFVMNKRVSIDIDDEFDFQIAEFLLKSI